MLMFCKLRFNPAVLAVLLAGGFSLSVKAAWNGAGVTGGTSGTNINDSANWSGGTIDDDFSTISEDADLVLTADYTTVAGLNFVEPDKNVARHITISGTNTITLRGYVLDSNNKSIYFPSNATSTVTLKKGLKLDIVADTRLSGFGAFICDAQIIGTGRVLNYYEKAHRPQSVLRNDANSFLGQVTGDSGTIYFTSVANKGLPCALGSGNDIFLNNFHISYIGSRDQWTDRDFGVQHANVGVLNNSACGGLSFMGDLNTKYIITGLNLGGISAGEGLIIDAIESSNLITNYVKLSKRHSGTWRLRGNNTFRGFTNETYALSLYGGTLIADYGDDVFGAGSNRLFLAGRDVRYENTNLKILGKSGAGNTTAQEFNNIDVIDSSANALTVDGNGGDGTTVSMGYLNMGNAYGLMLFDCINGGHVFATNTLSPSSGALRNINGVLLGNNGTRANLLMEDDTGKVGFVTQDSSNEFVRHTDTLTLAADNSSAADHVALAEDLTRTADLNFSTLAIDASANAISLNMAGNSLLTDSNTKGRGVVVNGAYPATVSNGSCGADYLYLYNYGNEKLTWDISNNSCVFTTAGSGLIEFTKPLQNNLIIGGGVTRLSAESLYSAGYMRLFGDGVLEIGADLNGGSAGDFSRWVGSGDNNIRFLGGGGFSAYGADRTVNLSGESPSRTYDWIVSVGMPLVLSSPYANATLTLVNSLNMFAEIREVRVHDGAAAVDARMTGKLSGYCVAALIKSGDGTLELTGQQDYYGGVFVISGGLRLGAGNIFINGANRMVLRAATLHAGTFTNSFDTLELLDDSTLELGDGSGALAFADSSDLTWTGTLTITGKLSATTLRFGTDSNALSSEQLGAISMRNGSAGLDDQGYLFCIAKGTMILVL